MEEDKRRLGPLFKEIINERGIKKSWVADKLLVSNSTITYILNGTKPLTEKNRIRLNHLLDTSIGNPE